MEKVLQEYLASAQEFARIGGDVSLRYFRTDVTVETKSDESPVTVADRNTEQAIRDAITARYPDHAIVGEEYGGTLGEREWEWILDPIDGTKSFIRGVPLYTTLIALVHKGEPVIGVIFAPATGEMVSAARGLGAYDELGRSVSTSKCTSLTSAWYMTTDPHDFTLRHPAFSAALERNCTAMRTWADAYGYLLLARGAVDLMVDPVMSPWDIAPLSVIVREARGTFSDLTGTSNDLGSSAIAAATKELHREVVNLSGDSGHR